MLLRRISIVFTLTTLVLLSLGSAIVTAQKKDEPKLPPINPAQARLEQTFKGLDGPGFAIASSDAASMVAAACDKNTIQLWHKDTIYGIRSGSNSANVLSGHQGTVTDLAWNGGPVMASSGADMKIVLWQVATGKVLHKMDTKSLVRCLAMSPDGKTLASAGDEPEIQLWDVDSAKAAKELKGHKDWVLCLTFSADGKQLLSGGYEGEAILWDVAGAKQIRQIPEPPSKKPKTPEDPIPVTEVAISPDGKQAVVGRANGTIDVVDPNNGKKIRTLTGHTSSITGLVYHPSGTLLVSSSKDSTVRLWNPSNGGSFKELKDHTAWVQDVAFLAKGTLLVSVGADRTVRVWNLTPQ